MDINDLRGLATVLAMVAFAAVSYWAYSGRKKQDFEEAALLPFADDTKDMNNDNTHQKKDNGKGVAP